MIALWKGCGETIWNGLPAPHELDELDQASGSNWVVGTRRGTERVSVSGRRGGDLFAYVPLKKLAEVGAGAGARTP